MFRCINCRKINAECINTTEIDDYNITKIFECCVCGCEWKEEYKRTTIYCQGNHHSSLGEGANEK